jgi:hypothetical protein
MTTTSLTTQALITIAEALGLDVLQCDNEGQVLIYTGIRYDSNGNPVVVEHDENGKVIA